MKSRKRIDALFNDARKLQQYPFRLLYVCTRKAPADNGAAAVRAGFTASSRNFPRAVDRNVLKRLMRESYRTQKAPLLEAALKTGTRIELFLVYTARELTDAAAVKRTVGGLILKLARELNENFSLPA
jgi:ribonuclease P protein component